MNEFVNPTVKFYRHSGKAPLLGLILLGVTGCIGVPILGLLYGALMRLIPFVYISVFIVVGYVFVVGAILNYVAMYAKIRNVIVLGLVAFFLGILADYFGWIGWLTMTAKDPRFLLEFLLPFDVLYIISILAKEGVWTISGITPTGGMLYFIWLLEAAIVIGGVTYVTVGDLAKIPFCEDSNQWANKRTQIGAFTPIPNITQFKEAVQQGNLTVFNTLKLSPPDDRHYITLVLYECDHCKNFFVLKVEDVTLVTNSKGRIEAKTKPILSNLILTPFQLASLRKLAEPDTTQTQVV